ncbi:hypothetical protein [Mycobacterium simulans]|nr:hypothetical protein [Mycobacterium simulans]
MGRHQLARKPRKRKPSVALAAVIAPAAVLFAAGGDVYPGAAREDVKQVVAGAEPCCLELVTAPPGFSANLPHDAVGMHFAAVELAAASRYRVDNRVLPVGVAPEQGLQVRTILVARSISAIFPEIHEIGGVRPDALRWHPNGLALDVMVPDPGSADGIALGNEIVAYALQNATRFGIQDVIWRGVYYTPGGGQTGGYGHYDHIHITTTGGGYPTGQEIYVR